MIALSELIRREDWTQKQAAARFGVTQPRISDLMRGRIDLFSLDTLVDMAAAGSSLASPSSGPRERPPTLRAQSRGSTP